MHRDIIALMATAALVISGPAVAQSGDVVTGRGSAPVTRDTIAVRAQAEAAAKADLVRAMVRQTIGNERLGELTPAMIDQLATQIRSDMIVDRSSARVGQSFEVSLSASVARDWFLRQLDDLGIQSSSRAGGGEQQRIVVMIDEAIGVAADHSRPAEIVTEYDRDSGASFSDQSTLAYSDRQASASNSSLTAGQTARSAAVGGYSDGYGTGVAAAASSRSSALSARDSSASVRRTALIDRTDVEVSVHDNVRFRQRVTMQSAATSATGRAAMSALTGALNKFDVGTTNATPLLATFQPGPPPMFSELQASGRLADFFSYAQSHSAPYFLSGALEINHGQPNPGTTDVTCSGAFNADVYLTAGGQGFASAFREATATGVNTSECENRLTSSLATQVAEELGPEIQRQWRSSVRARGSAVQAATGVADYTLTVRGRDLGMAVQADLLDALAALPGVEQQAFLGQDGNQISMQIRYGGSVPLHLALYQRLRSNPAFSAMQTQAAPQSVTLCLNGCQ